MFAVKDGNVLDERAAQIEAAIAEIKKSPEVSRSVTRSRRARRSPRTAGSRSRRSSSSTLGGEVDVKAVKTMAENTLKLDGKGGLQVALGGDTIHWATAATGGAGELIGILVAAVVLFLTLGVVAMGLPLLNALFAMIVSLSLMGSSARA